VEEAVDVLDRGKIRQQNRDYSGLLVHRLERRGRIRNRLRRSFDWEHDRAIAIITGELRR
jgi:hypothetical protein